jgi:hypothetical protein
VSASDEQPFHILVRIPRQAESLRGFIHQVVQAEKPAYATSQILGADQSATAGGAATSQILGAGQSTTSGGAAAIGGDATASPSGEGV